MHLLVISPASSIEMRDAVHATAQSVAGTNTVVETISCPEAPYFPGSLEDEALAVPHVLASVRARPDVDAYLIACHADPGVEAVRELSGKPAIGAGTAALTTARAVADRFALLAAESGRVNWRWEQLHRFGLAHKCTSIRVVGHGSVSDVSTLHDSLDAYADQGRSAVQDDGAGVIVLGCAAMAGLREDLTARVGVPVVDGVVAAVKLLEAL